MHEGTKRVELMPFDDLVRRPESIRFEVGSSLHIGSGRLQLRPNIGDTEVVQVCLTSCALEDLGFKGALSLDAKGHQDQVFASLAGDMRQTAGVFAAL